MSGLLGNFGGFDQPAQGKVPQFRPAGANKWRIAILPKFLSDEQLDEEAAKAAGSASGEKFEAEKAQLLSSLKMLEGKSLAETYTMGDHKGWLTWVHLSAWLHYATVGSQKYQIRCNSERDPRSGLLIKKAECCKSLREEATNAVFTVVWMYDVDSRSGQFHNEDPKTAFKGVAGVNLFRPTAARLDGIVSEHMGGSPINKHDLRASGEVRNGMTILTFRAANEALWRRNPQLEAKIIEMAQPLWVEAESRLGQEMTDSEIRDLLGRTESTSPIGLALDDTAFSID